MKTFIACAIFFIPFFTRAQIPLTDLMNETLSKNSHQTMSRKEFFVKRQELKEGEQLYVPASEDKYLLLAKKIKDELWTITFDGWVYEVTINKGLTIVGSQSYWKGGKEFGRKKNIDEAFKSYTLWSVFRKVLQNE